MYSSLLYRREHSLIKPFLSKYTAVLHGFKETSKLSEIVFAGVKKLASSSELIRN